MCNNFCSTTEDVVSGDAGESTNFVVIGDWGGLPESPYTTAVETAIAKEMAKFVKLNSVQFVLALGDNFYYEGVKDVTDPRFQVPSEIVPNIVLR